MSKFNPNNKRSIQGSNAEIEFVDYVSKNFPDFAVQRTKNMKEWNPLFDLKFGDVWVDLFKFDVKSSFTDRLPITKKSIDNFEGDGYVFKVGDKWKVFPAKTIRNYAAKIPSNKWVKFPSGDLGYYFPTTMYAIKDVKEVIEWPWNN